MSKSHQRILAIILGLAVVVTGCTPAATSGKGFTLPTGDADQGKAVFVSHSCHQCHKISGVEPLPDEEREAEIALGGEVRRISTYGELVTSVINPTHKLAKGYAVEEVSEDGESKMKNYNDVLTVAELIDLVAFLQPRYQVAVPQYGYHSYQY